jgi:hypothetical protein
MAATIRIGENEYDVEKDFSWAELMLIEELGGRALGSESAFESMATIGACVFVVVKRDEPDLTWEAFLERPMDLTDERPDAPEAKKPVAKARPTRRAKART